MADIIIPKPTEVSIEIYARSYTQWTGTAQQLIDEGLIPTKRFEWPQANRSVNWEAGDFTFWLRRTRPEGMKGPMRAWLENDYWFVRRRVTSGDPSYLPALIFERQMALRDALARGTHEDNQQFNRYWKAQEDDAFQSFKALIGLCPPERERKRQTKAQ